MQTKSSVAYRSFANFFMSLGLYSLILNAIGIKQGLSTNMFLVLFIVLSFGFINRQTKIKRRIYILLTRLSLIEKEILYYSIVFVLLAIVGEEAISGYLSWITTMIEQNRYITILNYEAFTKYALVFSLSLFIYISIKMGYSSIFILIYSFFIISWHFYLNSSYGLSVVYSIGVLAYFIDKATYHTDESTKESKLNIYGPIVGLLIAITAFIIPIKLPVIYDENYANQLIQTFPILESMRDVVQDKIGGSSFRFSQTPYQPDDKKLGGSVNLSKDIAFKVESSKPLYLRGSVKNEYTGYSWKNYEKSYYKMLDNKLELDPIDLGYKSESITIYPEKFKTRTIFNPYFTYEVDLVDIELIYTFDLEIMRNNGQKNQIKPYTVNYFDLEFIKERDYSDEENKALELYKSLPYSVTDRTKALAIEITKDKVGTYSKLIAIEDYLKTNYPYTLETSDLPEDTDFVDYFLFEEKKGYCTYFASAMAIMARSTGIATRYVEGFHMDDEKEGETLYIVREDRAHAWVEAYVPGTGWLTFEPTGSLTQAQINERRNQELSDNIGQEQEEIQDQNQSSSSSGMNEQIDAGFKFDDNADESSSDNKPRINYLVFVLIGLIMIIALNFKKILQKIKIYGIIKSKGKTGFMKRYYGIIDIVKLTDFQIQDLTPKETMNYINKKYKLVDDDLGELVNEVFYSEKNLSNEQINVMQEAYKSIIRLDIG